MSHAGIDTVPDLDRQLRATLETMALLGVVLDTLGRVVFVNDFTLRLLGWTRHELLGREWFEAALPEEIAGPVRDIFAGAIGTGEIPTHHENEVQTRTGQRRMIAWSNTMLRDASGHAEGVAAIGEDVTDRRAAEEHLRQVLAGVDAIVAYRSGVDTPLQLSGQVTTMLGYAPSDIADFEAWDRLVHPDDIARCRAIWTSPNQPDAWYLEYRVRRADGTWMWVDDRGRRTTASTGRAYGVLGLIADATSRRAAAERLRVNEARLGAIFEENPEAIGICTPVFGEDGRFVDALLVAANRVMRERYLDGARIDAADPPHMFETWPWVATLYDAAVAAAVRHEHVRLEHHAEVGGRDLWTDLSLFPFEEGFAFIGRDVTEQKRAQVELLGANARLRRVFDAGIIGVAVARRTGLLLEANDYYLNLLGRTRAELERGEVDWRAMTTPDTLAEGDAALADLGDEPGQPQEKRYLRPDGTTVPALVIRATIPGEPDLITALALDMSHEHAARSELARLATAISHTSESVVITDRDANIVYVNPAFERVTGYSFDEVRGRNPRILKSGVQPKPFYTGMWAQLTAGETWRGELVNRRKDGSLFMEEVSISPIFDSSGAVTSYVAVKRDASAERELESQLRQAQRVEAIGQLAGGVAHDFNNYLAAIRGYGELVQGALPAGSAVRADMDEVMRAAVRASDLTSQLLAFSRSQALDPDVLDPAIVIDALVPMLRSLIGEHIALVSVHEAGLGRVRADGGRLEQVIVNLAVNARDAMPDGGRLTIETRNVAPRGEEPAWVRLTVSDTGVGMPAEVLGRIFEPFYTTKGPGHGTGMGLATVQGIVQQSGGRITVRSSPGAGSTFTIELPHVNEPATVAPASLEPAAWAAGEGPAKPAAARKRVLLVEDDAAVRMLLSRLLTRLGHEVVHAGSGDEAIELIGLAGSISADLLVTDVRMPGMQGPDLAFKLRAIRPDLPVLFVSGYASEISPELLALPGTWVLNKPFEADTFAAAVNRALTASPG